MRYLALAMLALGLASCNQQKVNDGLLMSYAVACAAVEPTWQLWATYTKQHAVSSKVKANVAGAYAAAQQVCVTPPVNTAEAVGAAIRAAVAFTNAVQDAKNGG